jgi:methyl-accepting chemotaxis protein
VLAFNTWKASADYYGDEFKNIMKKADEGQLAPRAAPVEAPPAKGAAAPVAPAPAAAVQTAFLANGMIGPGKDRFRTLLDGTTKMRQAKATESAKSVQVIRADFDRAALVQLGVFLVGALIAAYLMFSIPKSVQTPIDAFVGNVEKMSKGDLKQAIDATGAKEFDKLASSLDRLRIAQAGLVDRLRARAA